jgi:hypothetical protein
MKQLTLCYSPPPLLSLTPSDQAVLSLNSSQVVVAAEIGGSVECNDLAYVGTCLKVTSACKQIPIMGGRTGESVGGQCEGLQVHQYCVVQLLELPCICGHI